MTRSVSPLASKKLPLPGWIRQRTAIRASGDAWAAGEPGG
jgi:hypothetical protein